jgi:hypothetical protein
MGFRRSQVQILSPRHIKAFRSNELRKAFLCHHGADNRRCHAGAMRGQKTGRFRRPARILRKALLCCPHALVDSGERGTFEQPTPGNPVDYRDVKNLQVRHGWPRDRRASPSVDNGRHRLLARMTCWPRSPLPLSTSCGFRAGTRNDGQEGRKPALKFSSRRALPFQWS